MAAQRHADGAESVTLDGQIRLDRNARQAGIVGISGERIQNVVIPDPILLKTAFIDAGSDEGLVGAGYGIQHFILIAKGLSDSYLEW